MSPSSNLAYLLTLSPVLLCVLLALSLAPESAVAAGHGGRSAARRHASFAARRAAGEFDIQSNEPRTVTVRKRADGKQCKVKPAVVAAVVASSAVPEQPAMSATFQEAAAVSTQAWVAPTTSTEAAWVAPTSEPAAAYVAPTTTSQAWSAPAETTKAAAVEVSVSIGAPATNSNSGSSRKAGLAWPNGNSNDPSLWAQSMGKSWYYTWSPWSVDQLSGLEFVPMLWGWKQVGDWQSNIDKYAGMGVTHALFANEPNGGGQANMPASSGCDLWTQQFEQLRYKVPGVQLGSASPDGAPSGKQWLLDFEKQCPQNHADFITLHWYDVTYQNFQEHVLDYATTFGRKLWITEYACQNFNGGAQCDWNYVQNEFFDGTTKWMNGRDEIERYAPFGAMQDMQGVNNANQLMSGGGSLTSLGAKFAQTY